MSNKTKKCKSKCVNLPRDKCYKGCIYTDHCRLSSKYKLDKKTCKLLKRTEPPSIQSFRIPKKDIASNILHPSILSYSPEINKILVQSRYSPKYDIFDAITQCMNIDVEEYTLKDSILKYYINPKIKLKNGECVAYWNTDAQALFLDNLSKHNIINIDSLIVPKQSYYNCWFNTSIMMNYISDKGRKFNKYFRQYMITGKMKNLNPFLKKLKAPLFLFNIAIEATLHGNILAKIMNTNDLIEKIHEGIPKEYKSNIVNKKEYGNPYNYQIALLNYISNEKYAYHTQNGFLLYSYMKDYGYVNVNSSIIWAEINQKRSKIINNKDIYLIDQYKKKYILDSLLLRDTNKKHFCCLLTINGKEYKYDGAFTPSIIPFQWKNKIFLNSSKDFFNEDLFMEDKSVAWNMRNGYQVLNYYRI